MSNLVDSSGQSNACVGARCKSNRVESNVLKTKRRQKLLQAQAFADAREENKAIALTAAAAQKSIGK